MFDPRNHYWLANDGRLFGSARAGLVADADADEAFVAWGESGRTATAWPRDTEGAQSISALQEVLAPYGLFVDLVAYAANARWRKEVGGITIAGIPVATDDRSKIMIMGARVAAESDPDWSTIWHGADGVVYPLNAAAMTSISDAVEAHVNATFATFATVKAEIAAGKITTTEQVDSAFFATLHPRS